MSEWTRSNPRARKKHKCSMCYRIIQRGETYMRGVTFDGTAWTWKECAHCEALFTVMVNTWGESEYSADDADEWEPQTLGELRVKVQWKKAWTRADGSLFPVPIILRTTRTYSETPFTVITGIAPGAAEVRSTDTTGAET